MMNNSHSGPVSQVTVAVSNVWVVHDVIVPGLFDCLLRHCIHSRSNLTAAQQLVD